MENPFDQNQVYERFLYDYFINKGLYETAEVFRQEAEARASPLSPSEWKHSVPLLCHIVFGWEAHKVCNCRSMVSFSKEIDVPYQLLLEWWVVNSDFSEWERNNSLDNEGSSYRDEGNMPHQSDLTLSREYSINEQMIEELTLDNSFDVILRENLVPVPNPGNLLTSFPHGSQGGTNNQGLELVEAFVRSSNASNESQSRGKRKRKRKRSRRHEDRSIDIPAAKDSHLETSSIVRDSDHPIELPSCRIKVAEDWMASPWSQDWMAPFQSQDNNFNLPSHLVEEKNDEEGNICSEDITFKLSSLVEEKKEDTCFIKDDTFELSSVVKGKKNVEGDSSSQDADMYDSSSYEDNDAISIINDETQGGITRGKSVSEIVMSAESSTSPPANLGSTDAEGLDSVLQTILRTIEIATIEEEGVFSSQYETFKLTSSPLEEKKDEKGDSFTKNDRFKYLLSPVEEKEDDEGDSATRNAHLYGSSHVNPSVESSGSVR